MLFVLTSASDCTHHSAPSSTQNAFPTQFTFFFLSSRKSHPLPRQQNCQSAWTKRSLLLCWIRFWEPFHHTTTKKRGVGGDPVTMKYFFEFDFLDSHIIHHSRCKEAHKTAEIHKKYHVQLLFSVCQLTVNLNALCPEWLTQRLSHFIFHKGRKGGSLLLMFVSVWISRPLSSIFSHEQKAGKKKNRPSWFRGLFLFFFLHLDSIFGIYLFWKVRLRGETRLFEVAPSPWPKKKTRKLKLFFGDH